MCNHLIVFPCHGFAEWRRSLFALLLVCPAPLGKQQVGDRLDVKSLAMPRNISGFAMNSYRDIAILRFFHNDGSTNTQFHWDTCEYRNAKALIKKLGGLAAGHISGHLRAGLRLCVFNWGCHITKGFVNLTLSVGFRHSLMKTILQVVYQFRSRFTTILPS